jgi:hypothetical protein
MAEDEFEYVLSPKNEDYFIDSYKTSMGLFNVFDSSHRQSFLSELIEDSEPLQ